MAEDVFQATFLQVHLKRENFEEGRRFRPWLYTIATNQAIDAQRRNRRHRMVSLDQRTGGDGDVGSLVEMLSGRDSTAGQKLEDEESKNWVRAAVEELPDPLKSADSRLQPGYEVSRGGGCAGDSGGNREEPVACRPAETE